MSTLTIQDEQLIRLDKFPPDRIPFYNGDMAVAEDKNNIQLFMHKAIKIGTLCRRVEKSNFLPEFTISPEMMMNELRIIGWVK